MRTNKLLNRFATKKSLAALTAAFSLAVFPSPAYSAILGPNGTRHVLLISIDGMHALEFSARFLRWSGRRRSTGLTNFYERVAGLSQVV